MPQEGPRYQLSVPRFESNGFVTHRAIRIADGAACLAKRPLSQGPSEDAQALQHEERVVRELRPRCALQPIELVDAARERFLVFEDFPGVPLQASPSSIWPESEILRVGMLLCAAIQDCHRRGLIHRRISPQSVLYDADAGEIRLVDFVCARSRYDRRGPQKGIALDAWSAPEQSGQVTLEEGEWTDLYGLGATLYSLACGRPPLSAAGADELRRALVSEDPLPLRRQRSDLSTRFDRLVGRLLAKNPSDRPHSAELVQGELSALAKGDGHGASFQPTIGCSGMYGRTEPFERLLDFCTGNGTKGVRSAWISGIPGLGKSRLVDALRRPVQARTGLFGAGKFDQFRCRRPYSAFLQAMNFLLERLLGLQDDELEQWRRDLREIDSHLLAVLVQQLPLLTHFVGAQPAPLPLAATETANRFASAISALLDVLATPRHALVLAIDDLQWADAASVELLDALLSDGERMHLAVVLAYRPEDLEDNRAASALVRGMHAAATLRTLRIELAPLDQSALAELCADALGASDADPVLVELVAARSGGNPFVAIEILRQLHRTSALRWDRTEDECGWQLNAERAHAIPIPESIVAFVVARLNALSPACQRALAAASCIGFAFSLEELAAVLQRRKAEVAAALTEAVEDHLVISGTQYSSANGPVEHLFSHDRVRQAAIELASLDQRRRWSRALAFALMDRAPLDRDGAFRVADYFGDLEARSEEEGLRVGTVYALAGTYAKEDVAYGRAAALFTRAISLLTPCDPRTSRSLLFSCQLQLGESLYLSSEFVRAERALEIARGMATDSEQQHKVERTRITLLLHRQRYDEAIAAGVAELRRMGWRLPAKPAMTTLAGSIGGTLLRVQRLGIDRLRQLQPRPRPGDQEVFDLLILLSTPAYWANQNLNLLIGLHLMRMTLDRGNTAYAPMAYATWAILNQMLFRNPRRALSFGQLAGDLLGEHPMPLVSSRVRFVITTFVGTLMRDNRANVAAYEEAFRECVGNGEHVFAGHCIDGITTSLPVSQFRLPEIETTMERWDARARSIGADTCRELIAVTRAWCRELSGAEQSPSDQQLVAKLARPDPAIQNSASLAQHRLLGMISAYLNGDYARVERLGGLVEAQVEFIRSNPLLGGLHALLVVLCRCRQGGFVVPRRAKAALGRLETLTEIYTATFLPMRRLARAQVECFLGRRGEALRLLKGARSAAVENGDELLCALADERLAELYELDGDRELQEKYTASAAEAYGRWGAVRKMRALVVENAVAVGSPAGLAELADSQNDHRLNAVLQATDLIAGQTNSPAQAEHLLAVVAEAAGAQSAVLFRNVDERFCLSARIGTSEAAEAGQALDEALWVPRVIIRYALRTGRLVHVNYPVDDPRFEDDLYLRRRRPRSSLCLPLTHRGRLLAVMYFENGLNADEFTTTNVQIARVVAQQAAVAMATANYYRLEAEAIQARINPHFLYNTLSVIAELVHDEPDGAESALVTLARLYRYMLGCSPDQVVTVDRELAITRDYLEIEKHRFGARLSYEIRADEQVRHVLVPALLLQPLVENAVRHGIGQKLSSGHVWIYVGKDQEYCLLRVADDGPGVSQSPGGSGFGLRSVSERLRLIYGDDFSVETFVSEGYTIELRFPLSPSRQSVVDKRHRLP